MVHKSISALASALCVAVLLLCTTASAERWAPGSVTLKRQELAPGVYAVIDVLSESWLKDGASAATSGGFVVGEKGVFVVESFVNARLAGQMLSLINEVTKKPVLYVVNTSYHGDHMYGNYMFPNATIIMHEGSQKYIEESWATDVNFMTNMFGHPEGYDDLKKNSPRSGDILVNSSTEKLTIDLGGRIVEVRQFGFAQTLGDLQVWLPEEKVLWTGNPVVGPAPLLPWLTEGGGAQSLETLKRIRDFLPADSTIVPGHSVPFKVGSEGDGLDYHIAYLDTMEQLVSEAVAEEMSLQEAVEYAAMEEFNGYDVFNWSHKQINVPCVFRHHMLINDRSLSESAVAFSRHCKN